MEATATPLTPEARAIGTPRGEPFTLSDGRQWIISDRLPYLGGVFDMIYDHNVLAGKYQAEHLLTAAQRLLQANYRLSDEEAFGLVQYCDPEALVPTVELATFGPPEHTQNWAWSDWIIRTFLANGIDLDKVPADRITQIMDVLIETKRASPEGESISSQAAAAKRHKLINFGKD